MGIYAGTRGAEWTATHDKWETTRMIAMRTPMTSLSAHSLRRQQFLHTLLMASRISRPRTRTIGNLSVVKTRLQHRDGWRGEKGAVRQETSCSGQKIRWQTMLLLYRLR